MLVTVTDELSESALTSAVEASLGPRLFMSPGDYSDVTAWAERSIIEIGRGDKHILVAFRRRTPIGSIIFQRHKSVPGVLEVRRIAVRPDESGRGVAAFLLRLVELFGREELGCTFVWVDTKVRNTGMCLFLEHEGYDRVGIFDLYRLGDGDDALYAKAVRTARRR